jgi:hypothetical protein
MLLGNLRLLGAAKSPFSFNPVLSLATSNTLQRGLIQNISKYVACHFVFIAANCSTLPYKAQKLH